MSPPGLRRLTVTARPPPPNLPPLPLKTFLLSFALAFIAPFALLQDTQHPEAKAPAIQAAPITVIALRHAEKGKDDPRDPHLSETGTARAAELARLLGNAGVTHIYTTPYHRTRDTVTPLAEALELEVSPYDPFELANFAAQLATLEPGSVAVVSGHSNTTPALVELLGGTVANVGSQWGQPTLDESEYDRAFLVTLATEHTAAKAVELRYGAAK